MLSLKSEKPWHSPRHRRRPGFPSPLNLIVIVFKAKVKCTLGGVSYQSCSAANKIIISGRTKQDKVSNSADKQLNNTVGFLGSLLYPHMLNCANVMGVHS